MKASLRDALHFGNVLSGLLGSEVPEASTPFPTRASIKYTISCSSESHSYVAFGEDNFYVLLKLGARDQDTQASHTATWHVERT